MFRGLWAIIYKELLQLRRDPATRFVFLIPAIQTIIFGFAIDMDIQHLPTVVFDMERSAESRRFVEALANTRTFDIIDDVASPRAIRERIVAGKAKVGVIIPQDFTARTMRGEQATVQVVVDGSEATAALNAQQTSGLVGQIQALARAGLSPSELPIEVRPRVLFNPDLVSSHFYVPGLVGIILQLVTVMLTAFAIVRERERGTLEQLAVTPVGKGALVLGKLLPYAIIGFGQALFVLILMRFLFGVEIAGSLFLLLSLSALFLLPSLALGILISTVARNQAEAMQMNLLVMLPSVLLSGFAFPRETMPLPIYGMSMLIPVTYYVEILRGIILRGAGLDALWPQATALAAFAVVLVTASAIRFKKRIA